jgi:hypothetical protein
MSIDNLFRQLKDIQFQADKILKSKRVEDQAITSFAEYSKKLKGDLIGMQPSEDLAIHVNDIEPIDPAYDPKPPFGTVVLGALSFGVATKKFKQRKREEYFRHNVRNTRDQFGHIDFLLKEM